MIALWVVALFGPDVSPSQEAAAVRVEVRTSDGHTGLCSGVVIGARSVLTAAHCTAAQAIGTGASFSVVADGVSYVVQSAVHDPDFDLQALTQGHDLSVLTTQRALPVTPLSFDGPAALADGASVRVVGFGLRDDRSSGERFEADIAVLHVTEKFLELAANDEAPCLGDSGGPVFSGEQLVGIVSYSDGCGAFAKVTRLTPYQSFLREQTRARGCGGGNAALLVFFLYPLKTTDRRGGRRRA